MSLWDEAHRGRHHYANLLSKSHIVIWVNRNINPGEKYVRQGMEHVKDGLYVFHAGKSVVNNQIDRFLNVNNRYRLWMLKREMKRLSLGQPDIVWCYDYKGMPFIKEYFGKAVCIYFCNDWFGDWKSRFARWGYFMYETKIASKVDYIITISPKLCSRFKPLNENTYFVPHGLWVPKVAPVYGKKKRPEIVGYIGTLNNTVDIGFLTDVIDKTECDLLLAGPIIEVIESKRNEFERLIENPRVKYLGDLKKHEADDARSKVDILLLPYYKSKVREYGFPIKYFEYLGSGKTIVSTDYMNWPDIYKHTVYIYRENDNIQMCFDSAYQRWNEECFKSAIKLAKASSWGDRVSEVSKLIHVDL